MPAHMKRILFFLFVVTLASFMYEKSYTAKTSETSGQIISIVHKGKALNMTIEYIRSDMSKGVFSVGINVIDSLVDAFKVGDTVPVMYCDDCSPAAKVSKPAYMYTLTMMLLMLDIIFIIVLIKSEVRRKKQG